MAVNTRIVEAKTAPAGLVEPPEGYDTPDVKAVCLVDGAGNIVKAVDNGDGTATLASQVSVSVEPVATTTSVVLAGAPPTSQVISGVACTYCGFALRETSGTSTATVVLWDNATAATGTPLDEITLAANESARENYSDGIVAANGIYAQIVSGSVAGSIRKK